MGDKLDRVCSGEAGGCTMLPTPMLVNLQNNVDILADMCNYCQNISVVLSTPPAVFLDFCTTSSSPSALLHDIKLATDAAEAMQNFVELHQRVISGDLKKCSCSSLMDDNHAPRAPDEMLAHCLCHGS